MKTETKENIILGSRVKDKITGFSGIITAVTHWVTGCTRYGVEPEKLNKDGKIIEQEWFDEDRLSILKDEAFKSPNAVVAPAGPPAGGIETG